MLKTVTLYHLINGVEVPYTRQCEFVRELPDGRLVVRIKGAADNHYRNRTVNHSQISHAQVAA